MNSLNDPDVIRFLPQSTRANKKYKPQDQGKGTNKKQVEEEKKISLEQDVDEKQQAKKEDFNANSGTRQWKQGRLLEKEIRDNESVQGNEENSGKRKRKRKGNDLTEKEATKWEEKEYENTGRRQPEVSLKGNVQKILHERQANEKQKEEENEEENELEEKKGTENRNEGTKNNISSFYEMITSLPSERELREREEKKKRFKKIKAILLKRHLEQKYNGQGKTWCDICKDWIITSKQEHLHSTPHNIEISKMSLISSGYGNQEQEQENDDNEKVTKSKQMRKDLRMFRLPGRNSIDPNNIGFKLLMAQGWQLNQGLGKQGQGMVLPIAPEIKNDRLGIGIHKQVDKKKEKDRLSSSSSSNKRVSSSSISYSKPLTGKEIRKMHAKEAKWTRDFMAYMKSDH